ncbi:MAG: PcrA [Candidatus Roizmanbacteria bacterium GW2011_GWA2_35_19]|uniref:DNA 3'-5' helicase n=2 Tax=Candidatus Roizmaniibacteriota TaxID=1752723 RepID=A0A0G0EGT0_9BACT|nr:MAG: PcrA [Candidatus Roizmanbacteria bacterium GW2011_GWC2_35_12]KKP74420.1 MAG: PcrA [Candidatus Roizmanbacteria bacterium GW2011_GWA2_35_19]
MYSQLFNQLNNTQRQAVSYADGPSIILAGAGSGKTRVLVSKVLYLISQKKVDPKSIVMITFTNKAAGEMKNRMLDHHLGFVGTFHSFCVRILRIEAEKMNISNDFLIYDDEDQSSIIKSIIKEMQIGRYTAGYFQNRISAAKNMLLTPIRYAEIFKEYSSEDVFKVYNRYQVELKKNQALDFDDLIMKTVELFQKHKDILNKYQNKYKYFLVDEFQDTNTAQYMLTKLLADSDKNITIVGDFSQSIYSWRGAEIKNLEKFKDDFKNSKTFFLEENYRSTQSILNYAYDVISKNSTHPILKLYTKKNIGDEVAIVECENEEEEALMVVAKIQSLVGEYDNQEIAILYRTNAQSRALEEVLLHSSVPYVLIGGTRFYERKEIKDILSYLRLLVNPVEKVSTERIIKLGKRRWEKFKGYYEKNKEATSNKQTIQLIEGILADTEYLKQFDEKDEEDYSRLENIKELKSVAIAFPKLNDFLEQVALVESEYSSEEKNNKNKNGIKLMTLHQAKGLEFKVVFVVGLEEGLLPHSRSLDNIYSLEEERRLFYVGITRAKERLIITHAKRRFIFGRRGETMKSRFLE